jgi:hypothetical protein
LSRYHLEFYFALAEKSRIKMGGVQAVFAQELSRSIGMAMRERTAARRRRSCLISTNEIGANNRRSVFTQLDFEARPLARTSALTTRMFKSSKRTT